jgi:hypothetical protein
MKVKKRKSILEFQLMQKNIHHVTCDICKMVSLSNEVSKPRNVKNLHCCKDCKNNSYHVSKKIPYWLPIWYDEKKIQYQLPEQLKGLREGEKLLIQLANTYVPLQHLRKGSHGCQGHVCCFPADVSWIAKELPKKCVDAIRIIKYYKSEDDDIGHKMFVIRKKKFWKLYFG